MTDSSLTFLSGAVPLLSVSHLTVEFLLENRPVPVVRDIGFEIYPGKTLGLVGESGCGKSMTGLALLRLTPRPGRVAAGTMIYRRGGETVDLASLDSSGEEIRRIRGGEIAMIFQEPMSALNPVYTIGQQIGETIRLHAGTGRKETRNRAIEALRRVGVPGPETRVDAYPHQLSGGLRQRAMIAMALSCSPRLLIADEPTTALDVTIQAQIVDLLKSLQEETGMAILMITHDLGVMADMAHDIAVMYAGQIVEHGPPEAIYAQPRHPYTQGLLASVPRLAATDRGRLSPIPGVVPQPGRMPEGCSFRPRCGFAFDPCTLPPPLRKTGARHHACCWLETAPASLQPSV
ncbi:MAG: ABC transporter ATP-binding protein [candidate division Zixibacteria bacterium]|nr:ABC transporter ATP-binding protein [candidate division Zixibacteria bacterium]